MTEEIPLSDISEEEPYQVMPELSDEEYAAVKSSIKENGFRDTEPVEVVPDGDDYLILDGHHRVKACRELDIETVPAVIREGLSESERKSRAWERNMQRRHLDDAEKKGLIEDRIEGLMDQDGYKTDEELAEELAVSRSWVNEVRRQMANAGKIDADSKFATQVQQREKAKELVKENPDRSNRDVAEEVGVSRTTVGNIRDEMEAGEGNSPPAEDDTTVPFSVPIPVDRRDEVEEAADEAGYDSPGEHIAAVYLDHL